MSQARCSHVGGEGAEGLGVERVLLLDWDGAAIGTTVFVFDVVAELLGPVRLGQEDRQGVAVLPQEQGDQLGARGIGRDDLAETVLPRLHNGAAEDHGLFGAVEGPAPHLQFQGVNGLVERIGERGGEPGLGLAPLVDRGAGNTGRRARRGDVRGLGQGHEERWRPVGGSLDRAALFRRSLWQLLLRHRRHRLRIRYCRELYPLREGADPRRGPSR